MELCLILETIPTPIGDMVLVGDYSGVLHAADFADHEERLHRSLTRRIGAAGYKIIAGRLATDAGDAINAYFAGNLAAIDTISVKMHGTPFQEQVWQGLRTIAAGTTLSYGVFAALLGRPDAARAVGHANGANPFNIIIPCHRLVAGTGALTGYAGGIGRKRWLLSHEMRYAKGQKI